MKSRSRERNRATCETVFYSCSRCWCIVEGSTMPAACTLCGNLHETNGPCPRCGGRSPGHDDAPNGVGPRWLHTVAGRLIIGLIVSQGLFYALERLLTGVLLAIQGGTAQELWSQPSNLNYLQAAP